MTWQRHKGTSTLPPRWTSGRWTIYRGTMREWTGKPVPCWELWDTANHEHHGYHRTIARAKARALVQDAKLTNAATAP